jgi:hypothetical protein
VRAAYPRMLDRPLVRPRRLRDLVMTAGCEYAFTADFGFGDAETVECSGESAVEIAFVYADSTAYPTAEYLVVNGSMFGRVSEPGEPDWSTPDVFTDFDFGALLGTDAASYAEENPHMIVTVVEPVLRVCTAHVDVARASLTDDPDIVSFTETLTRYETLTKAGR